MPPRINFQRDHNSKQAVPGDNSQRHPQLLATDSSGLKETSGFSGTPVANSDFIPRYDKSIPNQPSLYPLRPAPTEDEGFGRSSNQLSIKAPLMSDHRNNSGVPSLSSFDGRYDLSDQPYPAVIPVDDISSSIGIAPSLQRSNQSRSVISSHAPSMTGHRTESEATDTSGNNSPNSSMHAAKHHDTVRDPRLTKDTHEPLVSTGPAFALPTHSRSAFDIERRSTSSANSHENVEAVDTTPFDSKHDVASFQRNTTFNHDSFQSEVITHQPSQFLVPPVPVIPASPSGKFLDTQPLNLPHANPSVQLSVPFANSQSHSFQYTRSVTYNNDNDNDEVDDIYDSASDFPKPSRIPTAVPRYTRGDTKHTSSTTITQTSVIGSSIPPPPMHPQAHYITDHASPQLKTNLPAFTWKNRGIGSVQHNIPIGIEGPKSSVGSDNDDDLSSHSSSLAPGVGPNFDTSHPLTHGQKAQFPFQDIASTNLKYPAQPEVDTQSDRISRSELDYRRSKFGVTSSSAFGTSHTEEFNYSSTSQAQVRSSHGMARFEDTQVTRELPTKHRTTNVTAPSFSNKLEDINSMPTSEGTREILEHKPSSSLTHNRFGFASTLQPSTEIEQKDATSRHHTNFIEPLENVGASAVPDLDGQTDGSGASNLSSSNEDREVPAASYLARSETKLDTTPGLAHDPRGLETHQTRDAVDEDVNLTLNARSDPIQQEEASTAFQAESITLSNQEAHYRNTNATDEAWSRQPRRADSSITQLSILDDNPTQSFKYQSSQVQRQTHEMHTTTRSTFQDQLAQRASKPSDSDDEELEYLEDDDSDVSIPSENLEQTSFNRSHNSKAAIKPLPAVFPPVEEPSLNPFTGRFPERVLESRVAQDLRDERTSTEWIGSKEVHEKQVDLETVSNAFGADHSTSHKADAKLSTHQPSTEVSGLLSNQLSEQVIGRIGMQIRSELGGMSNSTTPLGLNQRPRVEIDQPTPTMNPALIFKPAAGTAQAHSLLEQVSYSKSPIAYKPVKSLDQAVGSAASAFDRSTDHNESSGSEHSFHAKAGYDSDPSSQSPQASHHSHLDSTFEKPAFYRPDRSIVQDTTPATYPMESLDEQTENLGNVEVDSDSGSFSSSSRVSRNSKHDESFESRAVYHPEMSVCQNSPAAAFAFKPSKHHTSNLESDQTFEAQDRFESSSSPSSRASHRSKFDQAVDRSAFYKPDSPARQFSVATPLTWESSNKQTKNFEKAEVECDSSSSSSRGSHSSKLYAPFESPALHKPGRPVGQHDAAAGFAFEPSIERHEHQAGEESFIVEAGSESSSSALSSRGSHHSEYDQALDKSTSYPPDDSARRNDTAAAFNSEVDSDSDSLSSSCNAAHISKLNESFESHTLHKPERSVGQSSSAPAFAFKSSMEHTAQLESNQTSEVQDGSESDSSSQSSKLPRHSKFDLTLDKPPFYKPANLVRQESVAAASFSDTHIKEAKTFEKVEVESDSSSSSSSVSHAPQLDQPFESSTVHTPEMSVGQSMFDPLQERLNNSKRQRSFEVKDGPESGSSSSSSRPSHVSKLGETWESVNVYEAAKSDSQRSATASSDVKFTIKHTADSGREHDFEVEVESETKSLSSRSSTSHRSKVPEARFKESTVKATHHVGSQEDSHLSSTTFLNATPTAWQNTSLRTLASEVADESGSSDTDEINSSSGSSSDGGGTPQATLPFVQTSTTDRYPVDHYAELSSRGTTRHEYNHTSPVTVPMALDSRKIDSQHENQPLCHTILSEEAGGVNDQPTTQHHVNHEDTLPISAASGSTSDSLPDNVSDHISTIIQTQNVRHTTHSEEPSYTYIPHDSSRAIRDNVASPATPTGLPDYLQTVSAAGDDVFSHHLPQEVVSRLAVTDRLQDESDECATGIHSVTANASTSLSVQVEGSSPHQPHRPSSTGTWNQEDIIPSSNDLGREQKSSSTCKARSYESDVLKRPDMTHDSAEEKSLETYSEHMKERFELETSSTPNFDLTQELQFSGRQNPTTHPVRQDYRSNDHSTTSKFKSSESPSQVTMNKFLCQSPATTTKAEEGSHSNFTEHQLTTTTTTIRTEHFRSQEISVSETPQDPTSHHETISCTTVEKDHHDHANTPAFTSDICLEAPAAPNSNTHAPYEYNKDETQARHPRTHSASSHPHEIPLFAVSSQIPSQTPVQSMLNVARQYNANAELSDNGTGSPEVSMIFRDLSEEQSALDISVELDAHPQSEATLHQSTFRNDYADADLSDHGATSQNTTRPIRTTQESWASHSRRETFTTTHESIPEVRDQQNQSRSSPEVPVTLASSANPSVASPYGHTTHVVQGFEASHYAEGSEIRSSVLAARKETSENAGDLASISFGTKNDHDDVIQAPVPVSQMASSSDIDDSSSSLSVSIELEQRMVNRLAMSPGHSSNILRNAFETAEEANLDILEDVVAQSPMAEPATRQQDEPLNNPSREVHVEHYDLEAESQLAVSEKTPKEFQPTDLRSELEASQSIISNMILEDTSHENCKPDAQRSLGSRTDDAYQPVHTERLSTLDSATFEHDTKSPPTFINHDLGGSLQGLSEYTSDRSVHHSSSTFSGETQELNKTSTSNTVTVSSFNEASRESHIEFKPQDGTFQSSSKEPTSGQHDSKLEACHFAPSGEHSTDLPNADRRAPKDQIGRKIAVLAIADQSESPLKVSDGTLSDEPSSPELVTPDVPIDSTSTVSTTYTAVPITDATVDVHKSFSASTKVSETNKVSPLSFSEQDSSKEHSLEADTVDSQAPKDLVEETENSTATEPAIVARDSSLETYVAPSDGIAIAACDDLIHVRLGKLISSVPSDTCGGPAPLIVESEVALKNLTANTDQFEPHALHLVSRSMTEESFDIHGAADLYATSAALATVTDGGPGLPTSTNVLSEPPQEERPVTELESVQTTSPLLLDANTSHASPTSGTAEHVTRSLVTSEVIETDHPGLNHQISTVSLLNEIQSGTVMNQVIASDIHENQQSTTDSNAAKATLAFGFADTPELLTANTASSEHTQEDQVVQEHMSATSLSANEGNSLDKTSGHELSDRATECGSEADAQLERSADLSKETEEDKHPEQISNDVKLTPTDEPASGQSSPLTWTEQVDQPTQHEGFNTTSESVVEIGNRTPAIDVSSDTIELSPPDDALHVLDVEPRVLESQDGPTQTESTLESSNFTSDSVVEINSSSPSLEAVTIESSNVTSASVVEKGDPSPLPEITCETTVSPKIDPDMAVESSNQADRMLQSSTSTQESIFEIQNASPPQAPGVLSDTVTLQYSNEAEPTILSSDTMGRSLSDELNLHTLAVEPDASPDDAPEHKVIQSRDCIVQAPDQAEATLEVSNTASNVVCESLAEMNVPSSPEVSSEINSAVSTGSNAESKALKTFDITHQSSAEGMLENSAVIFEVVAQTGESSPLGVSSTDRDLPLPEDNSTAVALEAEVSCPLEPVREASESRDDTVQSYDRAEASLETTHVLSESAVEDSSDTRALSAPEDPTLPVVAVESDISPSIDAEPQVSESQDEPIALMNDASDNVMGSETKDLSTSENSTHIVAVESVVTESQEGTAQSSKEAEVIVETSNVTSDIVDQISNPPASPELSPDTRDFPAPEDSATSSAAASAAASPDLGPKSDALQPAADTVQSSCQTKVTLEISNVTSERVVEISSLSPSPELSSEDRPTPEDSTVPTLAVESAVVESEEEIVQLSKDPEVIVGSSNITSEKVVEMPAEVPTDDKDLPPLEDSTLSTAAIETGVPVEINSKPKALEPQDEPIHLPTQAEEVSSDTRDLLPTEDFTSPTLPVAIEETTQTSTETITEVMAESSHDTSENVAEIHPEVPPDIKDLSPPEDSTLSTVAVEADVGSDLAAETEASKSVDDTIQMPNQTEETLEIPQTISENVAEIDNSPPTPDVSSEDLSTPNESNLPTTTVEADVSLDRSNQPEELKLTEETTGLSAHSAEVSSVAKGISLPEELTPTTVAIDSEVSLDVDPEIKPSESQEEPITLSSQSEEVPFDTKDLLLPEDLTTNTVPGEPEVSSDTDPELKASESQDDVIVLPTETEDNHDSSTNITQGIVDSEIPSLPEASSTPKDLSPSEQPISPAILPETGVSPDLSPQLEELTSTDETVEIPAALESSNDTSQSVVDLVDNLSPPEVLSETQDLSPLEDSTPTVVPEAACSPDVSDQPEELKATEESVESPQTDEVVSETKELFPIDNPSPATAAVESADSQDEVILTSPQTEETFESPDMVESETPSPPDVSSQAKDLSPRDDASPPAVAGESEVSPEVDTELKADSQDEVIQTSPQTEEAFGSPDMVESETPSPPDVSSQTKDLSPRDDASPPAVAGESEVSPEVDTELKADSQDEVIQTSPQTEETSESPDMVESETPPPPDVSSETKELSPTDDTSPPAVAIESEVSPEVNTEPKADSQDEAIQVLTKTKDMLESSKVTDLENLVPREVLSEMKELSTTDDPTPNEVVVESHPPEVTTELKSEEEGMQTSLHVEAETKDLSLTNDSTPPTVVVESEVSPDLGLESEALKPTEDQIPSSTQAEATSDNQITETIEITQTEVTEAEQVSSKSNVNFPTEALGSTSPPTLFHASTTSFLRTPAHSMVSVPRPQVDPAAIARLLPTAPVVRNIRREVILPARMKKLSTISTVSVHPPLSSLCVINSPEKKKKVEVSEEKKTTEKSLTEEKSMVVVTPKRQSIFSSKCKGEASGKKIAHEHVVRADSLRKHQVSTLGSRHTGRKSHVTLEEGSVKGKSNRFASSTSNMILSGRRSVDVTRTSRGQPFQTNLEIKRSASVKHPNRALEILKPRPRLSRTPERTPARTGIPCRTEQSSPSTSRQLPSGPVARPRTVTQKIDDFDIIEVSDTVTEPMATDPNCNPKIKNRLSTRIGSSVREILQKHGSRVSQTGNPFIEDNGIEEEFDIESEFQRLSGEIRREEEEQTTQVQTLLTTSTTPIPKEMRSNENDSNQTHHSNEGNLECRSGIGNRFRNKITSAAVTLADKISKNLDLCDECI